MKKASTHLFDLIKMMSASERRYFQKYAQRHSKHHDNQYLQLFYAISTMQEYDEVELKEVLKDTTIVAHFAKYQVGENMYLSQFVEKFLGSNAFDFEDDLHDQDSNGDRTLD